MKRNVIKHGPSTLIVSLPAKWVKEHNLTPGSEVDIEPQGNTLIITTGQELASPELLIDVTGLTPFLLTRLLARCYQKGYDIIHMRYKDRESLTAIRGKVSELLGMDILEEGQSMCTLQSLAKNIEIDFDAALRKAFYRVLENMRELNQGYDQSDTATLEGVWDKDLEVNKLTYFCLRAMTKGKQSGFGAYVTYNLVETLEDVGDEIKRIARYLAKSPQKNALLVEKLRKVEKLLELVIKFYYAPRQHDALDGLALIDDINQMQKLCKHPDLFPVLIMLSKLTDYLSKYFTMRLDTLQEVRPPNKP